MNHLTGAARSGHQMQSPRNSVFSNLKTGGLFSDFFRYHGVWAPGIRVFRALGFGSKALLISAVFMVPIAWLAYAYFSDRAAAIAFSSKERVGVAYARAALPLLPALQTQRLLALQAAASGQAMPEAAQARADVEAALKKLAAVQARLGGELDTDKAHAKLLERLAALPAAIVSSAKRVQELLHQVAMGAHQQTTSVAHTAQAVQELDKVTQQNSALVEQTAAAAATLNERAVHLADEVAQFKLPAD